MRKQFDVGRDLGPEPARRSANGPALPMDVVRRGDQFVLFLDVPGVDPGSIDVRVDEHVLTITAERRWEPGAGDAVVAAERPQGRVSRRVVLGNEVAADRIAADWQDGVLTLTVPLAHHAARRTIPVRSGRPASSGGSGSAEGTMAERRPAAAHA